MRIIKIKIKNFENYLTINKNAICHSERNECVAKNLGKNKTHLSLRGTKQSIEEKIYFNKTT